ncbi:MAG: AI-2E family transporter [Planctomycetota bacterium]|jgi:predicted PurR-regulated permease PerM
MQLSERQQRAVATAVTILAAVVIVCAVAGLLWLVAGFLKRFSSVFLPLAVGAVAALVFNPYYEWLRRRLRLPTVLALTVVFVSILVPVAAFVWFFGALVVEQVSDLVARLPEWWRELVESVQERWPKVVRFFEENPWGQRIRQAVEGQQSRLVSGLQEVGETALSAGAVVLRGIGAALAWAVLPVYFAFFLMADPGKFSDLERYLPFLKPETRKDLVYLAQEFVNMVVSFFRGQLIVALLQGLLFAIGFSAVGLRYGFVLGLVLGFLNIIPYLGSIVGLSVALPLALFQNDGGWVLVAWVLGVFAVVQMIEGYLLTPKIMGDRTGLHPVAIIVAIFFWGSALGGILGMILAIPLTAFLVVAWRLAKDKYIEEWV